MERSPCGAGSPSVAPVLLQPRALVVRLLQSRASLPKRQLDKMTVLSSGLTAALEKS